MYKSYPNRVIFGQSRKDPLPIGRKSEADKQNLLKTDWSLQATILKNILIRLLILSECEDTIFIWNFCNFRELFLNFFYFALVFRENSFAEG
jgi:hypothetical protein